ncbi:hypothetical protein [Okeania sp. SIO2B3]|uniref:hypothetical protein n=1 Tax=Okeania sp. SIO2B3 TaxID=2607784 RepID=UPI0013BFBF10|nr:hypothetical protein [Okeania sp. SIO2B3]NET41651.1 hypothetical protein [Okeania sp. SIO2B3]
MAFARTDTNYPLKIYKQPWPQTKSQPTTKKTMTNTTIIAPIYTQRQGTLEDVAAIA